MNNKIPLRVLAQQMAQASGLSENECQEFVKILFQNVSDELYRGNEIVVDGVGTFSIDASNIEPVRFEVDSELASELNAPFSFFQPVTLTDSLDQGDIEKLHDIDAESESTRDKSETIDVDDTNKIETDSGIVDTIMIENTLNEAKEQHNEVEDSSNVNSNEDVAVESPTDFIDSQIEPENSMDNEVILPPEIPDIPSLPQINDSSDLYNSSEPTECKSSSDTEHYDNTRQQFIGESTREIVQQETGTAFSVTEQIYIPEEEEEHVEYHTHRRGSRFWIGFIVGLLTGLILAAVAYAIYVVRFS